MCLEKLQKRDVLSLFTVATHPENLKILADFLIWIEDEEEYKFRADRLWDYRK